MEEFEPQDEVTGESGTAPSGPAEDARDRGQKPGLGRAIVTGIALGLREVLDPKPRDKIAIEQEAPGEPTEPQRLELHLDQGDPRDSYAIYRPELDGEEPYRAYRPTPRGDGAETEDAGAPDAANGSQFPGLTG